MMSGFIQFSRFGLKNKSNKKFSIFQKLNWQTGYFLDKSTETQFLWFNLETIKLLENRYKIQRLFHEKHVEYNFIKQHNTDFSSLAFSIISKMNF